MAGKRYTARAAAVLLAAAMVVPMLTSCNHKETAAKPLSSLGSSEVSETASGGSASSLTASGGASGNAASETSTGAKSGGKTTKIDLNSVKAASGTPSAAKAIKIVDTSKLVIYPMTDPVITVPSRDLGGRTIVFATVWPQEYQQSSVIQGPGYGYRGIQYAQKQLNCVVKVKQLASNYTALIQKYILAGKKVADIYDVGGLLNPSIQNGYFQDLRKVKSVNLAKNGWNEASLTGTSYKNGIYGVCVNQLMINRACIYFNKAIAAKYNLGDFYSMVYNYSWNLTNFEKLCQAAVDRSQGTVAGVNAIFDDFLSYFTIQNNSPFLTAQNGKVNFTGDSLGCLQVLNWLQDCYRNKLVDSSSGKGSTAQIAFKNGKVLFFVTADYQRNEISDMKDDYGMLPLPCGFGLKNYYSVVQGLRYYCLGVDDPNYEDDGAVMTAIAKGAYIPLADWDKDSLKVLRDSQSIQMMHLINQSKPKFVPQFGDSSVYQAPTLVSKALQSVYQQKQSAKQAMSGIKKAVQKDINTIYNS